MHYRELKKRIKKNEGFSLKPYKDQLGYLTIGYGHLILPNETYLLKNKTNKPQLNSIFDEDFERALGDYKRFIKQKHHNRKDKEGNFILQKHRAQKAAEYLAEEQWGKKRKGIMGENTAKIRRTDKIRNASKEEEYNTE